VGAIQPWEILRSEPVADCRIFKVRKDITVNPRTGEPHDMFVVENPDWLNVIPLTADERVVMVEQWRHGTRTVHLETPGGLMDGGETVEACARRELREETGYNADKIIPLGQMHPNPAFQTNTQYYALATGCRKIAEPTPEAAEDIQARLVALAEIPAMVERGEITHALVIGAFYWLDVYRRKQHAGNR
jgi:8-oxo-dGTP pyrophosphatase MutT (NUDIX family)